MAQSKSRHNQTHNMSRSMCILFVALAIFQVAVANVVENSKVVNLKSTEVVVSPYDVFGIERDSCSNGALTVGQRRASETLWYLDYEYNNNGNSHMSLELHVTVGGGTIHYVSAVNKSGYSITICDTPQTLGSDKAVVIIKTPPHSTARIDFTIGAH